MTIPAIKERRSHRRFTGQPVPPELINEILEAGLLAPSAKNRQPWLFISCGPESQLQLLRLLKIKQEEMAREGRNIGSLPLSIKALEEASHIILIYNDCPDSESVRNRWKADMLSLGACIQNMLLTAQSLDVQTLWICDVLFAEHEINDLSGIDKELISAVAFGRTAQRDTPPRPREALASKHITLP